MKIDKASSNDDVQTGKAFKSAMGMLAVAAVAATVGLVALDVEEASLSPRALRTDANAHRPAGAPTPSADAPLAAPAGDLDSTLSRPDRGSDQHG